MRLGAGSNVGRVVTWLLQRAVRIGRPMPRSLFHVLLLQLHPPTCKMHFLKKSSICFFRLKLHYSFWNNNKLLFCLALLLYYNRRKVSCAILWHAHKFWEYKWIFQQNWHYYGMKIKFSCWKIANTLKLEKRDYPFANCRQAKKKNYKWVRKSINFCNCLLFCKSTTT